MCRAQALLVLFDFYAVEHARRRELAAQRNGHFLTFQLNSWRGHFGLTQQIASNT